MSKSKSTSQLIVNKRMREIWIDGFVIMPYGTAEPPPTMLREALRQVVNDDAYWVNLTKLREMKKSMDELSKSMKRVGRVQ
jgi:hypothetical protein